jgi:hypothetical protein
MNIHMVHMKQEQSAPFFYDLQYMDCRAAPFSSLSGFSGLGLNTESSTVKQFSERKEFIMVYQCNDDFCRLVRKT